MIPFSPIRRGMRFGCPNGHPSRYTVYGQSWHRCALCGREHTFTDVPEEPDTFFDMWREAMDKAKEVGG